MVFIGAVPATDDNLELLSDITGLALNCYHVSAVVATSAAPITVSDVYYIEQQSTKEDNIGRQVLEESLQSLQELEKRAVLYPDDTGVDKKTLSEIRFLRGDRVILNGTPVAYILRFHWQ